MKRFFFLISLFLYSFQVFSSTYISVVLYNKHEVYVTIEQESDKILLTKGEVHTLKERRKHISYRRNTNVTRVHSYNSPYGSSCNDRVGIYTSLSLAELEKIYFNSAPLDEYSSVNTENFIKGFCREIGRDYVQKSYDDSSDSEEDGCSDCLSCFFGRSQRHKSSKKTLAQEIFDNIDETLIGIKSKRNDELRQRIKKRMIKKRRRRRKRRSR